MPEGDTLFRTAAGLRPHLVGRAVTAARATPARAADRAGRRVDDRPRSSRTARTSLIRFDNGLELRTHLRMNGSWHRYRPGERWRRPPARARLVLEVPGAVAVCFDAPVVELFEQRAEALHPTLVGARAGPARPGVGDAEAARRSAGCATRRARDGRSREALLDQRALAGHRQHLAQRDAVRRAGRPVRAGRRASTTRRSTGSSRPPAGCSSRALGIAPGPGARLRVYRRAGRPCPRCGTLDPVGAARRASCRGRRTGARAARARRRRHDRARHRLRRRPPDGGWICRGRDRREDGDVDPSTASTSRPRTSTRLDPGARDPHLLVDALVPIPPRARAARRRSSRSFDLMEIAATSRSTSARSAALGGDRRPDVSSRRCASTSSPGPPSRSGSTSSGRSPSGSSGSGSPGSAGARPGSTADGRLALATATSARSATTRPRDGVGRDRDDGRRSSTSAGRRSCRRSTCPTPSRSTTRPAASRSATTATCATYRGLARARTAPQGRIHGRADTEVGARWLEDAWDAGRAGRAPAGRAPRRVRRPGEPRRRSTADGDAAPLRRQHARTRSSPSGSAGSASPRPGSTRSIGRSSGSSPPARPSGGSSASAPPSRSTVTERPTSGVVAHDDRRRTCAGGEGAAR